MYDKVIKLVGTSKKTTNEYGDTISTPVEREAFAELKSIGTAEFYQAQAAGLKPEVKLLLPDYLDYQGENTLKYTDDYGKEEVYTIIRTYRTGNQLELTCKRGVDT